MIEEVITSITEGINKAFNGGMLYDSVMFTNGSLLTDDVIELAQKSWHLKKIQLTIDGYGIEHNCRKNYAFSGVNYYKKILQDIQKLLACGIAVDCRVNLDKDNFQHIDEILLDLYPFKGNPLFRPRLTILRPSDCGYNQFNYITPSDLKWAYSIIYKKLYSHGFLTDVKAILPQRQKESCIAKSINKVIIGADGKLYKCLQQVFDENHTVGILGTGIFPSKFVENYCKKRINKKCEECIYLPMCSGGCSAYWDLKEKVEITPCIREKYFFDMLLEFIHECEGTKE